METGTLYVVATPIGNLADISRRAIDILSQVDVIAAEDTRVTQKLLAALSLQTRLISLREHNEAREAARIVEWLREGKSVAQVSDAGTPSVSDPGAVLVDAVRAAGLRVVPVPGANAAIAALSASGFTQAQFLFYGFLPPKSGQRKTALEALREQSATLVFYEAPHRIVECIDDLLTVFGPERQIVLARELTKTFEQIHRCPLGEAPAWLASDSNRQRGEFVLLVAGAPEAAQDEEMPTEALRVLQILLRDLPVKQASSLAAEITGANRKRLYQAALELRAGQD
ncbi:MAG: 16S rRNA (cytidine(1402)-2'-O)-methyltransferase [Chitinivorax sp.]